MKVVSANTMAQLESEAVSQGYRQADFMEQAGREIALHTENYIKSKGLSSHVYLLCGKGNNGGDAFVAGYYLLTKNIQVEAIQLDSIEACSPLCQAAHLRFVGHGGKVHHQIISFNPEAIILDGLFGTGFRGKVKSPYDALIHAANESTLPILSIDIPSGLDGTTGSVEGKVIHATETLFLGLPKTGFFLGNGWNVVGDLHPIDFGLPAKVIENGSSPFVLLTKGQAKSYLPPIRRNRNKYTAGEVVGFAGSPSMPGAALLACLAALRGGCGIVRLLHPKGMEGLLAGSFYELIKIPYEVAQWQLCEDWGQKGASIFIGPGIGRTEEAREMVEHLAESLQKPCVIDADALFFYSKKEFALPKQVIFTPHMGEMKRLLGISQCDLELSLLNTCQEYAEKHHLTLILKGAPTFIFHPGSTIHVSPTGDPGMATAGSGDVLTGLLASLLAQGLDCHKAALLGVYLHGLAGELAKKRRKTSYGMIARDLIDQFSAAYAILGA